MRTKEIILLSLVPLSESKALFYNYNEKVSWYLFSNDKRYLCNVVEDYSNIIIFGVIFFYLSFVTMTRDLKIISFFLFIINALDFVHLGLYDLKYFIIIKLILALFICKQLKTYLAF